MQVDDRVQVGKTISAIFVLDSSKLRRIVSIAEDRCSKFGTLIYEMSITLQSKKVVLVGTIEQVLDHDNTVKDPIDELSIDIRVPDKCWVSIEFKRRDYEIDITVNSEESRFTENLFDEIEEQIERTLVQSWIYTIKKSEFIIPSVMTLLLPILLIFSFLSTSSPTYKNFFLPTDTIDELVSMGQAAKTSEEKVEFLVAVQVEQLKTLSSNTEIFRIGSITRYGWSLIFAVLPIVVMVIAGSYLLKCYPGSVFSWGDYEEHYSLLLERRRFLWNAIVVSLAVGILANLAVVSLSRFMNG